MRITVYLDDGLQSGYHHIDILQENPTFLGFSWVQFVGKIISMGFVFGNITRIMTRYSHFDILRSPTWDGKISLSVSTLNELCF